MPTSSSAPSRPSPSPSPSLPSSEAGHPGAPGPLGPRPLRLLPFRGVRPDPRTAGPLERVVAPVRGLRPEQAQRHRAEGEHSILRLVLPEDGAGAPAAGYGPASARFRSWLATGALRPDRAPALYVHEQDGPSGRVRGLLGALPLPVGPTAVGLPAEEADPARVEEELSRMRVVGIQAEPVVLGYDGGGPATRVVDAAAAGPPLADVRTADGVRHRIWAIRGAAQWAAVDADLARRRAAVLDGHHRYLAYHRLRDGRVPGGGAGLVMLVDRTRHPCPPPPAAGLVIRSVHRV
ncbi:DUF1015 family protein [Kitasatospora sp. NBC_01539]|uniref:DUF1015 family protein n=1 Tax=Kitasatospora sp. NBC_01539 TaxID=2903577 RepID=UPI0038602924